MLQLFRVMSSLDCESNETIKIVLSWYSHELKVYFTRLSIGRALFAQVTVGKGVADLVLLPVEQYRRDGRVFRGLRKGTQSFLRAITIETLHTSHRVASYISRTLDDIVTQPGAQASLRGLEYYDEQPTGVIDSLEHAYDALAKEVQVWRFAVSHLAHSRCLPTHMVRSLGVLVLGKGAEGVRSIVFLHGGVYLDSILVKIRPDHICCKHHQRSPLL